MDCNGKLMTAEEYLHFDNKDRCCELVRGKVEFLDFPSTAHGFVCGNILGEIDGFRRSRDLVHRFCNNVGYITRRNPDTVRGPDISFFTYDQIPKGPLNREFAPEAPRLAFEVVSFADTWARLLEQISDHLYAGTLAVAVAIPETQTVIVFRIQLHPETLTGHMELKLPEVLGEEFSIPVNKFFE